MSSQLLAAISIVVLLAIRFMVAVQPTTQGATGMTTLMIGGCLVTGLKDVQVSVPEAIRRGQSAWMYCKFNLEGDPLYSVKWYKGRREFYRFTPRENPPLKVFPIPGLRELSIERGKSNATQLVLKNVVPTLSGKYSCEVSADAPSFHTALMSGEMTVVEVPRHRPSLSGIKPRYRVGDILWANCTSSGSRPAANITWLINGKPVDSRHVKLYKVVQEPMTELESSTGALELPLRLHHFTTHSRIKIRCTASIYGIYWQTTEKSAELERHRNGLMHNDVTEHDVINQNLLHLEPPAKEEEEEEITVVHEYPPSPTEIPTSRGTPFSDRHCFNVVHIFWFIFFTHL